MSEIYFHTYVTDLTAAEQAWVQSKLVELSGISAVYGEVEGDVLHLYSDEEESAELDVVAEMTQNFILKFRPMATIKFGYARLCDPNEDESGGGVIIVNATEFVWHNIDEWLYPQPTSVASKETN